MGGLPARSAQALLQTHSSLFAGLHPPPPAEQALQSAICPEAQLQGRACLAHLRTRPLSTTVSTQPSGNECAIRWGVLAHRAVTGLCLQLWECGPKRPFKHFLKKFILPIQTKKDPNCVKFSLNLIYFHTSK